MDEGMVVLIFVLLIIFLIFVVFIWLILYYCSKKQVNQGLMVEDQIVLQELVGKVEMMVDRIKILEVIFDLEVFEWRNCV